MITKPLRIRFIGHDGKVTVEIFSDYDKPQACGISLGDTPEDNRFILGGEEGASKSAVIIQTQAASVGLMDWEVIGRNGQGQSDQTGRLHLNGRRVEGDQAQAFFPVANMGEGPWMSVSLAPKVTLQFDRAPLSEQRPYRTIDVRIIDERKQPVSIAAA